MKLALPSLLGPQLQKRGGLRLSSWAIFLGPGTSRLPVEGTAEESCCRVVSDNVCSCVICWLLVS